LDIIIAVDTGNIILMVNIIKNNWLLIFLLSISLFLRTYRIDYLELFGDELDAGYQSYSLLTTGRDYKGNLMPSYIHSFSEWRAPGLMYAMVPFIRLFGLNEWGVRMGPAMFGLISIWGFYLILGLVKVEKNTKLLTVFLLAINPWHIQYSRATFEITLLSSLLIFGIYFLIRGIQETKNIFILWAGLLLSLTLYTYSTANVLMPLLTMFTIFYFKIKKKQFLVLATTGILISLPIIYQLVFGHVGDRFGTLNILNNKDVVAQINDYRNAGQGTFLSKIFYNKLVVGGQKVIFNYGNSLGVNFLFNEGDVTFRHSLHQVGNLFWIELPLIIWGLIGVVRTKKYYWIIGFLLISPIASSLTIDGYNHATRLFLLVFPLSTLAAYGLSNSGRYKFIFGVILIFEFSRFQYYYWSFYRDQSYRWWHTGYKESMQYIDNNKSRYRKVMMDNTYEPSLIRFLFWNKFDSRLVFNLADNKEVDVDGFNGFCLEDRYCFVNFASKFKVENLKDDTLYLISQERNVGGDWNWSLNPPEGIKVVKTVNDHNNFPIFYLVEKE